jgi:hypothetical protein
MRPGFSRPFLLVPTLFLLQLKTVTAITLGVSAAGNRSRVRANSACFPPN